MKKQTVITAFACLALPILMAGCATDSPLNPQPSLDQLSNQQAVEAITAVRIPDTCRKLAKRVKRPHDWVGKSVYASRREYEAKLRIANWRLGATDECIAKLAAAYAKGLQQ